jgi:hypothetical protein
MKKYTKIQVPFIRDTKTKKYITSEFADESIEFLKDLKWIGTEKIDGTNIGVVWDGHNVSFQGRTQDAEIIPELKSVLSDMFLGDINEEIFEQTFGEKSVILFGEGYGGKIGKYGKCYRNDYSFILFDVYMPDSNIWLKREAIESIAKTFNIDVVPIIFEGSLDEAIEFVKTSPKSKTAKNDLIIEGIVCKPYVELLDRQGRRIITKIKVKSFK